MADISEVARSQPSREVMAILASTDRDDPAAHRQLIPNLTALIVFAARMYVNSDPTLTERDPINNDLLGPAINMATVACSIWASIHGIVVNDATIEIAAACARCK